MSAPDRAAVASVAAAMSAWTTGDPTITGQVWVYDKGKPVSSFDLADDAFADVRERNARHAMETIGTRLSNAEALLREALNALNLVPNRRLKVGPSENTYVLAGKIERYFEEVKNG